jgi:hypothetical protein
MPFGLTGILKCSFSQIKLEFNFLQCTTYGVRENVQEKLASQLIDYLQEFQRIHGFDDASNEKRVYQFKRYVKQESEKGQCARIRLKIFSKEDNSAKSIMNACIGAVSIETMDAVSIETMDKNNAATYLASVVKDAFQPLLPQPSSHISSTAR